MPSQTVPEHQFLDDVQLFELEDIKLKGIYEI